MCARAKLKRELAMSFKEIWFGCVDAIGDVLVLLKCSLGVYARAKSNEELALNFKEVWFGCADTIGEVLALF